MASRPTLGALSCLQCRTAVLRAFASASASAPAPAPALRTWTASTTTSRPVHRQLPVRGFATAQSSEIPTPNDDDPTSSSKGDSQAEGSAEESASATDSSETPWYLDVEPPQHAPTQHTVPLPEVPEGSPAILHPILKYVYEDMGFDDLTLLDLRDMQPPPAMGSNLLMLFGSARSDRHLHVATSRLVKWLRYNHRIESRADGLIGPGELKTRLRRLRRKAKLLGSNAMPTGGDDGITTDWICVNLGRIGTQDAEQARFDEGGNLTGFGSQLNGATIVLQAMTESKRSELNLEHLWTGQLRRSREAHKALLESGEQAASGKNSSAKSGKQVASEEDFFAKFGKKTPSSSAKGRPRVTKGKAPGVSARQQQKRAFSTSRTASTAAPLEASKNNSDLESLDPLRKAHDMLQDIRVGGADITSAKALELLNTAFSSPSAPGSEDMTTERAALAVSVLETMQERGIPILNNDTLVTMIESIASSGPGTESNPLRQIQSNLEHLLDRAVDSSPSEDHISRLVAAYLTQRNFERLWDAWRLLPRHGVRRSRELYAYLFRCFANTKSRVWCAEALRTCVPEMLHEDPPVVPQGSGYLWTTIRECILIADPGAESLALASAAETDDMEVNKRKRSEFVKMYRQLNSLRDMEPKQW